MLWSLADEHADDNGILHGYTKHDIDEEIGVENFCDSLPSEWIDLTGEWVKLPEYLEHNGSTAKKRANTQKRVSKSRRNKDEKQTLQKIQMCNAPSVTLSILFYSILNNKDNSLDDDLVKCSDFVFLTKKQIKRLLISHGKLKTEQAIKKLHFYKKSKGKEIKCDYSAIQSWVIPKALANLKSLNSPARKLYKPQKQNAGTKIINDVAKKIGA